MTRAAPNNPHDKRQSLRRIAGASSAFALLLFAAVAAAPTAAASHEQTSGRCEEKGMNVECNEFATIKMQNQHEIRGDPIIVTVNTTVHNTFEEQGARYVMFSMRHTPETGSSPIGLKLESFNSRYGDIFTSRIDQDMPNEINVFVHVVDIPENTPITMKVKVSSSAEGAFRLESLVIPFDRGYEPIYGSGGNELTAYSFTLLGVNDASGSGAFLDNFRTPGLAIVPVLGAALLVALLVRRRSS